MTSAIPEVGYIYPAPYWSGGQHDWVKSLLLFFDQVAILLPDYMYGYHHRADPTLVGPLEERGLLHILEPRTWIDREAREELTRAVDRLLETGAFDDLDVDAHFQELSQSRAGYDVDIDIADDLIERLRAKGLVRQSQDGVSLPMHPFVRSTFLVLLGQLARGIGERNRQLIYPTTSHRAAVDDLERFLLINQIPTEAAMVEMDLVNVGIDIRALSIDDVVALRNEHRESHSAYMRSLRGFVAEMSQVAEPADRNRLVVERREEIEDEARRVQKRLRQQTRQVASFGIGIAGGAWSAKTGDPIGLGITAASLLAGLGSADDCAGAYSYLFRMSGA